MKLKTLLLNPPGRRVYLRDGYCSHISKTGYVWHPIDLLVQSGILSKVTDLYVIDAIACGVSESKVLKMIGRINPDLILTLHGAASNSEDLSFLSRVYDRFDAEIFVAGDKSLWGGSAWLKKHNFIKGILTDYKSNALGNYILKEAGLKEKGILWKDKDGISGSGGFTDKPVSFPVPRFELFPLNRYRIPHQKTKRFYSIMTSFGCPYRCAFCPYENIPFIHREFENIIEELKYVEKLNIRELLIKDECFGASWNDTQQFLDYLIKSKNEWCFSAEVRLDKLSERELKTIAQAGGHTLFFGAEIGDSRLLKEKYSKDIDIKKLGDNIKVCKDLNIKTAAHYILGLPGENHSSVLSTIRLSLDLDTDYAAFNIATPEPGTTFWNDSINKNLFDPDQDIDSSCSFPAISTPQLPARLLWRLYKTAFRKFYFRKGKIRAYLANHNSGRELINLIKTGVKILKMSV